MCILCRNPFTLSVLSHAESVIVDLAKIATIVSVTNAWPERDASAVKRINSQTRSQMKNDVLNNRLHISIKCPAVNSKEVDNLISRVVEKYINQVRYNVQKEFTEATSRTATTSSTQTLPMPETISESQERVETTQAMGVYIPNKEKEEY